jgi:hypothetical protein
VILLNSNRTIRVYEEDAPSTLEDLGLSECSDSWVLDLAEDIS